MRSAHNTTLVLYALSEIPEASHKASLLWWHQREHGPFQPQNSQAVWNKARLEQCGTGLTHTVSVQKYQSLQNNRLLAHHWFRKQHSEILIRMLLIKQEEKSLEPTVCLLAFLPLQPKKQFTHHDSKLTSSSSLKLRQ